MKKNIFIILACICLSGYAYSYPVEDAYEITGKDYFPEVKKLIRSAKKSIYVTMYIATYHPDHPKSPPNQLLEGLVKAKNRGVEVRIILDQGRVSSSKGQYNDLAYFYLKDAVINVDYDVPSRMLHDKLIIIDEIIVIIGSHNWSKSGLQENREASVVIKSPELACAFIKWIKSTPISPRRTPPPQAKAPNIYLPYRFLTDPELGIKLSDVRMELYLYLLKKWKETGGRTIILDYEDTAKFIGWDKKTREEYRKGINRILRVFHKIFRLVSFKTAFNKPVQIDLLDYRDQSKPLRPDPKGCFVIPGAFWDFQWAQRLSVSAKYFYFISLVETSLTMDPKGWWSHSQKHLEKKYHANKMILTEGIMELNRYNLLAVKYGPLVYPFKKYLERPRYRLLPLYSWEWRRQELTRLKELYGEEKLKKARSRAEVVLEENNLEVIEKLINYADEYGESMVQYAVDRVAKKRIGNRKRCFDYIQAIILGEVREQQ